VKAFVVDASVAVKWCLPAQSEAFVPQAEDLLAAYRKRDTQFLVPDLFWPELGNALWKAVRKGTIDQARAERSLTLVGDLEIPTVSSSDLIPQALRLALIHGRTVYDSLYVALAVQSETQLVTADERLANALAAHLPVKWLGGLSLSGQP
jgi:predicted nucleic acid-binding protein